MLERARARFCEFVAEEKEEVMMLRLLLTALQIMIMIMSLSGPSEMFLVIVGMFV